MFLLVYMCHHPLSLRFCNTILERITPYCPAKLLLLGDFNAILSPDLDRPAPPKSFTGELSNWALSAGVTEVWRWKFPSTKSFSCFSTSYKTASRIDYAFANPSLLSDVLDASYLSSGLSDHSPLWITLRTTSSRSSSMWRLGAQWISQPDIAEQAPSALRAYWDSNAGSSSPEIVWDAFKAFTRGHYISAIKAVRVQQAAAAVALEDGVELASARFGSDPSASKLRCAAGI